WRWINASDRTHPMHLHGFYYRVDTRGTAAADTALRGDERRYVVTETMLSGSTMAMTWSPDRPGNWLFHCHVLFHVAPDLTLQPTPANTRAFFEGMGGLVLALHVRPVAPMVRPASLRTPRQLRLLIQPGRHAFPGKDSTAFGFVLQRGS